MSFGEIAFALVSICCCTGACALDEITIVANTKNRASCIRFMHSFFCGIKIRINAENQLEKG
jgi:hypothetical protein